MSITENLIVQVPVQTATRLRAMAQARGLGTEGEIITEALAALYEEQEENFRVAALIEAGFASETWHDATDVRQALKQRFMSQ